MPTLIAERVSPLKVSHSQVAYVSIETLIKHLEFPCNVSIETENAQLKVNSIKALFQLKEKQLTKSIDGASVSFSVFVSIETILGTDGRRAKLEKENRLEPARIEPQPPACEFSTLAFCQPRLLRKMLL